VVRALRITEDRSLADVDDEPYPLGDDDVVGLAHPAALGDDTARWAEVFADYEILQPFPQLGRPTRFDGVTVTTTKVLTLDRRGWHRQPVANAGIQPGEDTDGCLAAAGRR